MYPRTCEICKLKYACKASFYKHKKICNGKRDNNNINFGNSNNNCNSKCVNENDYAKNNNNKNGHPNNSKCDSKTSDNIKNIQDTSNNNSYSDPNNTSNSNFKFDNCSEMNDKSNGMTDYEHNFDHTYCKISEKTNKIENKTVLSLSLACKICGKISSCKTNYLYHIKYICIKKRISILCKSCNLSFLSHVALKLHKRRYCSKGQKKYRVSCILQDCDSVFLRHSTMILHVERHHLSLNSNGNIVTYKFTSYSDFLKCKDDKHVKDYTYVVKKSGTKKNAVKRYEYFVCQFDAASARIRENRIYKTNRRQKVGKVPYVMCPSRLIVHVYPDLTVVKYIGKHTHDESFKNTVWQPLPVSTREYIEGSLHLGIEPKIIQERLQEGRCMDDEEYMGKAKRSHFLTIREIKQISRNLKAVDRMHKDDALSTHYLVQMYHKRNYVLVYKPYRAEVVIGNIDGARDPHELFSIGLQRPRQLKAMETGCRHILCVDSTFSIVANRTFYLVNFVIPDQYRRRYPVAHFITNFLDCDTLTALFRNLARRYPKLQISSLMTDDDPALFEAVLNVFPSTGTRHLLCKFHVLRSWENNIRSKIKGDEEIISQIKDDLKALMETRCIDDFNEKEDYFIKEYGMLDISKDFINYYIKFYSRRPEKWAMCYRNFPHAGTDTNNFVESYNNKLKTFYFERRRNRRVDDLLRTLLAIENDLFLQQTYNMKLGKPDMNKGVNNDKRHQRGMLISDTDIIQIDNKSWRIKSQSKGVFYTVHKKSLHCNLTDHCFCRCLDIRCWGLCTHLYECSCPDKNAICKHIHKIHAYKIRNDHSICINRPTKSPNCKNVSSINATSAPSMGMTSSLSVHNSAENDLEKFEANIAELTAIVKKNASTQKVLLPHINKSIRSLINTFKIACSEDKTAILSSFPTTCDIFPNEKLKTQIKFPSKLKLRRKREKILKRVKYSWSENDTVETVVDTPGFSFSMPITPETNVSATLFEINGESISIGNLKSLDPYISDTEADKLKEASGGLFVRGWICDCIIDSFLYISSSPFDRDIFVVNTIASTVLMEGQHEIYFQHNSIVNQIRHSKISLVPTNCNNTHWMLLVVKPVDKVIDIYDSGSQYSSTSVKNIAKKWINIISEDTGIDCWSIRTPKCALQHDAISCGVFVCYYANCVLKNQPVTAEVCIDSYRREIYETLVTFHTAKLNNIPHSPVTTFCTSSPRKLISKTLRRANYVESGDTMSLDTNLPTLNATFTEPLHLHKRVNEELFKIHDVSITSLALKSLDPYIPESECRTLRGENKIFRRGWLTSDVIDAYLYLCNNKRDVYIMSSVQSQINRRGIQFAIQHQVTNCILNSTITFIPHNPTDDHWILLVVYAYRMEIEVYDPMRVDPYENANIREYVTFWIEVLTKKQGTKRKWTVNFPPHIIQSDNISCGVMICWFVSQLLSNKSITDASFCTYNYRKHMYKRIIDTILSDSD